MILSGSTYTDDHNSSKQIALAIAFSSIGYLAAMAQKRAAPPSYKERLFQMRKQICMILETAIV